jgi:hypothetical protein
MKAEDATGSFIPPPRSSKRVAGSLLAARDTKCDAWINDSWIGDP